MSDKMMVSGNRNSTAAYKTFIPPQCQALADLLSLSQQTAYLNPNRISKQTLLSAQLRSQLNVIKS